MNSFLKKVIKPVVRLAYVFVIFVLVGFNVASYIDGTLLQPDAGYAANITFWFMAGLGAIIVIGGIFALFAFMLEILKFLFDDKEAN
jgi:hypothetical protein